MKPVKPQSEDGPEPVRMTPRRLGTELKQIAMLACHLRRRVLASGIYLRPWAGDANEVGPQHVLEELARHFAAAADQATVLGSSIEVGQTKLDERWLDAAHLPARPLLDYAEGAPTRRAAEVVRERIAEREPDDPAWTEESTPDGGTAEAPASKPKLTEMGKRHAADQVDVHLRDLARKRAEPTAAPPEPLPPRPPEYPPAQSSRANARKAKRAAKATTNGQPAGGGA